MAARKKTQRKASPRGGAAKAKAKAKGNAKSKSKRTSPAKRGNPPRKVAAPARTRAPAQKSSGGSGNLDALMERLRPFRVAAEDAEDPVVTEKELDAFERDAQTRLPRVLRALFARHMGVQFGSGELNFDDAYEAVSDNPLLEEAQWGRDYVQLVRESDGSRILIRRTDKVTDDVEVFRYGHDEGDETPQPFAPSISEWLLDEAGNA